MSEQGHKNPGTSQELVERLIKRTRESQLTHYMYSEDLSRMNLWIGVPSIIFSTIVASSIFKNIASNKEESMMVLVGVISLLAVLLTSFQTFLKPSERSIKHKEFAAKYGGIRRRLELCNVKKMHETDQCPLDIIVGELNDLANMTPIVPAKYLDNLKKLDAIDNKNIY